MILRNYSYENNQECWLSVLQDNGTFNVTCNGEIRVYDIKGTITNTDQADEYIHIFVEIDGIPMYYQFKFEVDNFLVGELFFSDGDLKETIACHVFGED